MKSVKEMSDEELEESLKGLVRVENEATADVLRHIGEFEERRLFAPRGQPSMYHYCTRKLGYGEWPAYARIYAARMAKEYPLILELLKDGKIHLATVKILGPLLTPKNHRELLERAIGQSTRTLRFLAVSFIPQPDAREVIRRLPELPPPAWPGLNPPGTALERPASGLAPEAPASRLREPEAGAWAPPEPPQKIEPLAPGKIRFAFTADEGFLAKVERARDLLKHKLPAGRLPEVFGEVTDFFLAKRDPSKKEKPAEERPTDPLARRVPEWVRDRVRARDGGRCAFVAADGTRCPETGGLEFDHVRPWAAGGVSCDPEGVRLLCKAHNLFEARRRGLGRPEERGGGGGAAGGTGAGASPSGP